MIWRDPHQRALLLIHAAAWMVPSQSREEWRREWTAELHYAHRALSERGEDSAAAARLLEFACDAFQDAKWHRACLLRPATFKRPLLRWLQSGGFCLTALGALVFLIIGASGLLPATRSVLLPLPYADAGRIATVSEGGPTLAVRSGIRSEWVGWWKSDSRLIQDAASYSWSEAVINHVSTLRATVGQEFFPLVGAKSLGGDQFASDAFRNCRSCVVLAYDFWRGAYGGKVPGNVMINGRSFRVAAILDRKFWFLTRRVGVWEIVSDADNSGAKMGVVVRLRPDVSKDQAEVQLDSILQKHGLNPWSSLVVVSPLRDRVRSVLGSFALALTLAIAIILPSVRLNFDGGSPRAIARTLFFCSKTFLLLLAVLLAGLEFTRAPAITMLGGTDLTTEPLSTWLFLLGSMGALSWSRYDQRRRCRVCLRRFGLAAQIGCPGCLLPSWAGTELVCLEGHGMLHVPEMVSSWGQRERWTSLDESVLELFTKGS